MVDLVLLQSVSYIPGARAHALEWYVGMTDYDSVAEYIADAVKEHLVAEAEDTPTARRFISQELKLILQ